MRAKLMEYFRNKTIVEGKEIEYYGPTSVYSYHTNFQHLRIISADRKTTPA